MRMPKNVKALSRKEHKTIHQGEEIQTIVDLPADLQDVYNVLHLTEKQFEVLDTFLEKALVALANQAKYEKALELMADDFSNVWADKDMCNKCRNCHGIKECIIEQYKKQAGLEG